MTRFVALPVMRCRCGREMVALVQPRCEFCSSTYWRADEYHADRAMDRRDQAEKIAEVYAQPGMTMGRVGRRFGISRALVSSRLREIGK